jgi:hypothetical protein
LTAHRQAAVVWTMICWLPVDVSGETELPAAADEVTAGVEPGAAPLFTAKIWKLGGAEGAGVHWNAQPMFQVPPAMVKAGLVQLPVCWVSGISIVAGPTATDEVVVDDPAAAPPAAAAVVTVVLLEDFDVPFPAADEPPAAVDVPPPALAGAVVVTAPDDGGGSLYPPPLPPAADEFEPAPADELLPVAPLMAMPTTAATSTATSSCQVFHERRSLMPSSPCSGR